MSDHHAGEGFDLAKHVRAYLFVFGALFILTIVTVAVSYLHIGGFTAIALGLMIATVKGSLVACYFMHLISERKLIYIILVFTIVFFLALLLLPVATQLDQVET